MLLLIGRYSQVPIRRPALIKESGWNFFKIGLSIRARTCFKMNNYSMFFLIKYCMGMKATKMFIEALKTDNSLVKLADLKRIQAIRMEFFAKIVK